ncbi:hypothetical protein K3U93_06320 [Mycobacterium malmoense]|uniref:Uncharacterized protein n=2 Tax=Mycobacterium malmoense TaxID=1780 RepID=A0ABX3STA6_MYCMA|nr:hypothetical protein [Mycobacterium malmoense]OIN78912.1 hypothetical protein BMG05_20720 [Mycobacterium malmoense]ORA83664.1 hypothetical protein BST29_09000 [Mycobacterium malmoense]QZA18777.1 hypothetical protein K3U93_06320 [Mycobacterium malmoense]UNB95547.1 hypothetical protein H5T25_06315 [Mycobacterium malmoense]
MMTAEHGKDLDSVTPLEAKIFEDFKNVLVQEAVSEVIVEALAAAFDAEKLPSAEALAVLIKERSGGPSA